MILSFRGFFYTGIPSELRRQAWILLAQQFQSSSPLPDDIDIYTPYASLLGQLTSQQHQILMDLGKWQCFCSVVCVRCFEHWR